MSRCGKIRLASEREDGRQPQNRGDVLRENKVKREKANCIKLNFSRMSKVTHVFIVQFHLNNVFTKFFGKLHIVSHD